MSNLSENEIKNLLTNLQAMLDAENGKTMETELESASKHLPAYIKIVKSHIDQLKSVLELENHNHRTLENAGLAAPVQQLIKLFRSLKDQDIQLLEDLAHTARNWHPDMVLETQDANSSSKVYEETAT